MVCHLTGGSEDARSILTVGGNPGFTLQGSMSSTMAVALGADDEINLSCHAEALDGAAPRISDARLVAYPPMRSCPTLSANSVTPVALIVLWSGFDAWSADSGPQNGCCR